MMPCSLTAPLRTTVEQAGRLRWRESAVCEQARTVLRRLVSDDSLDPTVKETALKKIESQNENYNHIEDVKRTQLRGALEREKTNLLIGLKLGTVTPDKIDSFDQKIMAIGDDKLTEHAAGWRQELLLAAVANLNQNIYSDRFLAGIERTERTGRPGWIMASEKNRKQMTAFVESQVTPDQTAETRRGEEIYWTRKVGLPTEQVYEDLKAGAEARNAEPLANAARLLNELRDPVTGEYAWDDLEGELARAGSCHKAQVGIDAGSGAGSG
jgi:hypothetical protein